MGIIKYFIPSATTIVKINLLAVASKSLGILDSIANSRIDSKKRAAC